MANFRRPIFNRHGRPAVISSSAVASIFFWPSTSTPP